MRTQNNPATGPRYWVALCVASMFGANMGDFFSRILGLGHTNGLAPLAIGFAVILLLERKWPRPTEAWYWLAIVTLRTAATNLGDLATHDFALPYPWVIAGLALLLGAVLLAESLVGPRRETSPLPATNGFYWAAMLVAGTLGTAVGDYVADDLGLGVRLGTVVLGGLLGALLVVRWHGGLLTRPGYWLTIVAVRSAGTTAGDFTAGRHGLGLGLPLSTVITGALLVALLVLWSRGPTMQPATAGSR
jgi:uncharacterized membrane-anchored protein